MTSAPLTQAIGTQTAAPSRKLVSIVIPVYNEADNVERTHDTVTKLMDALSDRYEFEFVFTDNHSTDQTFEKLQVLARKDPRIRAWRFSRNFGYQLSIQTGYRFARGACAIQLDADLQDPPELIAEFLQLWEQGYKVVYGVRKHRKESRALEFFRKAFYRIVDFLSDHPLPHDAGDFRLLDRCVLDEIARIDDPNIYLRGRIALMGFGQIGVPYSRQARIAGESKFRFRHLMQLALDAIVSHSVIPLRLATFAGVTAMLIAVVLVIVYLISSMLFGADWPQGFTTITVLLLLSIGLNGLMLGILGEYVARMYQQLKVSGHTIVEQAILPVSDDPPAT